MRDELAAPIDGVRVSGSDDPRSLNDRAHEPQIDLGDHRPSATRLGDGDGHVGLGTALEVDIPEVPPLGPREHETLVVREVDPAVEAVELEGGGVDTLSSARVQIAQVADELVPSEEAVEVLVALDQARSPRILRRLSHRLEFAENVLQRLFDRERGGGRLIALDPRQRPLRVLIGEVELREPDRYARRCDERDNHGRVFPDQASVRPCGRFHPCAPHVVMPVSGRPRQRG